MGIYSNGRIFGIKIYTFIDEISNVLYEEKYVDTMTRQQMREAYLFYSSLKEKNEVCFKIYTECSTTLDPRYIEDTFMSWYPLSLQVFLEKFSI